MQDSPPLLTVITVSFRDLERLKRTVESLKESDGRVAQIIVLPINDADSIAYLDSTLDRDPTTALSYVHDDGKGIYQAMSLGVAQVTSPYFTFWNSGDFLNSAFELSCLLDDLNQCEADWVLTNGNFNWIDYPTPTIKNLRRFILQEDAGYVSHQCILFRTDYFTGREIFNLKYKVAADTDQIYRIYRKSEPTILDYPIVSVEHGKFSSMNNRRARVEVFLLVTANLDGVERFIAIKNILEREFNQLWKRMSRFGK